MNVLRCALSGRTPPINPVVTPSGYICSKEILLSKLAENGGKDPFTNKILDEKSVIDIKDKIDETCNHLIQPPRFPSCTSIGGILHQLKSSYDAILLELYDTRRSLEETRRELTIALYQNDAAVRVISRVSMERDNARKELSMVVPNKKADTSHVSDYERNKRIKIHHLNEKLVYTGNISKFSSETHPKLENNSDTKLGASLIKKNESEVKGKKCGEEKLSDEQINTMVKRWKELSTARRSAKKSKLTTLNLTMDSISKYKLVLEKNIHQSPSQPGIQGLALISGVDGIGSGDILATVSKDNQIVLYNLAKDEIIREINTDLHCNGCIDIIRLPYISLEERDSSVDYAVCVACMDKKIIKWFGPKSQYSYKIFEDFASIISISIHPTGRHLFVTMSSGKIRILLVNDVNEKMEILATLNDKNTIYTTAKLHPDGLILIAGCNDGSISIWDLKTQVLASSLEGLKNNAITAVAFSENGYNFATATTEGPVVVWDLRKQTIVATLYPSANNNSHLSNTAEISASLKTIYSLAFDPSGKYLACGAFSNEILIVSVRNPSNTIILSDGVKVRRDSIETAQSKICELVWGGNQPSLISCSYTESLLKFWSIPQDDET